MIPSFGIPIDAPIVIEFLKALTSVEGSFSSFLISPKPTANSNLPFANPWAASL
ncbi:hypothetical protein [Spiroplasma clarkii]|uniref:hypothetical protein n=1 Tax=Spiroplasma clarkii TaxID=2139 RepID=UPI002FE27E49